MPQKLIQAVNKTKVTASFKNKPYKDRFKFEHWGVDCCSSEGVLTLWAQGEGFVLAKGLDNNYGYFVVIFYPDVYFPDGTSKNIIANYFHMAQSSNQLVGNLVNNYDSQIGVMGKTGTYTTGIHLHTEMRVFHPGDPKMASPVGTSHFKAHPELEWFNPLEVTYCKTTSPDNQAFTTVSNQYINEEDKKIKYISDRGLIR